jgi:uncharacterized protein
MSDSHDNLRAIKNAVNFFNEEQVDLVFHAGDLISPFTAQEFRKLEAPFIAIFGNNDGERDGLKEAYKDICYLNDFQEITVDKRQMAIIHGTNQALVESLSCCRKYDVVIRGHTHQVGIENKDSLVINPGETCGYLTGDKTVVLLEPYDLSYQVIHL